MVFKTTRVGSIPATLVTLYNITLNTKSTSRGENKSVTTKLKEKVFLKFNTTPPNILSTVSWSTTLKSKSLSTINVKSRSKFSTHLPNYNKIKNYHDRKKQRGRPYKFLSTTYLFHPRYTSLRRLWSKSTLTNRNRNLRSKDAIRRFNVWIDRIIQRPKQQAWARRKRTSFLPNHTYRDSLHFYKQQPPIFNDEFALPPQIKFKLLTPLLSFLSFKHHRSRKIQKKVRRLKIQKKVRRLKIQKKALRRNLNTLRDKYLIIHRNQNHPQMNTTLTSFWLRNRVWRRRHALALTQAYNFLKNTRLGQPQSRFATRTNRFLGKPTYNATLHDKDSTSARRLWTWNFTPVTNHYTMPLFSRNRRPAILTYAWVYIVSIIYTLFFSSFSEPTSELSANFQLYQSNLYLSSRMCTGAVQALQKRFLPCNLIFNLGNQSRYRSNKSSQLTFSASSAISVKRLNSNLKIWTGVTFPFLVRWATQQFYFFRHKKKIYLGLYLTTAWRVKPSSIHYMATRDQVAFRSSLVFTEPQVLIDNSLHSFTPNLSLNSHLFLSTPRPFSFSLEANPVSHLLRTIAKLIRYYKVLYLQEYSTLIAIFRRKILQMVSTPSALSQLFQTKLRGGYLKFHLFTKVLIKRCRTIIQQRSKQRSVAMRYKSSWVTLPQTSFLGKLVNYTSNLYTPLHAKGFFLHYAQDLRKLSTPCLWSRLTQAENYTFLTRTKRNQFMTNGIFHKASKYFTSFSWCIGMLIPKASSFKLLNIFPFYAKFFYCTLKWAQPSNILRSFYSSFNFPNLSTNILPTRDFKLELPRLMSSARANVFFQGNITPWAYMTLLRFIEFSSGKKVLVDVYSFMDQTVDLYYVALYRMWMPRFAYYERRLGHRFFLEEALHMLHMSFVYQDSKLLSSWLKAIIQRISFWKTRFIFRFLKYLLNTYFYAFLYDLGIKGLKIKLKGKISVAGNSRKRTILYRLGKTSHAEANLKVVHTMDTIVTFTGVMGFQIWIFY